MLNGILIIDKPEGISSARVVARVKKLLNVKKAGHTGTLDPFATGVLVCCINQATKLSRFFLHSDKAYEATLCLGVETDTLDRTGTVTEQRNVTGVSAEILEAVCAEFRGTIRQIPPVYSALKHKGVPLYKLARKGKPVQKPPREVVISRLKVLGIDLPEVRLAVSCSGGTYIRTLAADIGRKLRCGAHLTALRRTASSHFTLARALSPKALEAEVTSGRIRECLIPMADALCHLPAYVADKQLTRKIMYGNTIAKPEIPLTDGDTDRFIRILDKDNNLLSVLSHKKAADVYDYCCVFTQNMDK